jgi:hypothetical protein
LATSLKSGSSAIDPATAESYFVFQRGEPLLDGGLGHALDSRKTQPAPATRNLLGGVQAPSRVTIL